MVVGCESITHLLCRFSRQQTYELGSRRLSLAAILHFAPEKLSLEKFVHCLEVILLLCTILLVDLVNLRVSRVKSLVHLRNLSRHILHDDSEV